MINGNIRPAAETVAAPQAHIKARLVSLGLDAAKVEQ